jgi:hypothetical protein
MLRKTRLPTSSRCEQMDQHNRRYCQIEAYFPLSYSIAILSTRIEILKWMNFPLKIEARKRIGNTFKVWWKFSSSSEHFLKNQCSFRRCACWLRICQLSPLYSLHPVNNTSFSVHLLDFPSQCCTFHLSSCLQCIPTHSYSEPMEEAF